MFNNCVLQQVGLCQKKKCDGPLCLFKISQPALLCWNCTNGPSSLWYSCSINNILWSDIVLFSPSPRLHRNFMWWKIISNLLTFSFSAYMSVIHDLNDLEVAFIQSDWGIKLWNLLVQINKWMCKRLLFGKQPACKLHWSQDEHFTLLYQTMGSCIWSLFVEKKLMPFIRIESLFPAVVSRCRLTLPCAFPFPHPLPCSHGWPIPYVPLGAHQVSDTPGE